MNTTTKTFIPPENSENQEPQLDLNLLDAKLTDQPEQQKVNQILDNAINTETEDTLESGLFLHVAEEMLEALFQVDTEVFKTQIAQQAEIRKRLQLLISKLSGKQTSLDDIQQLKLELVKVLFSKEEIQVTELKDFAKKFKLKFNQLIVSLLRDSQISEEQNKAFDTFREKLNKDQLKKQVETNEISLSDYLILTEDFEILDQYQDFDKEIQVTQNLYNAFESTPKFSKIKDTGKFYLFSALEDCRDKWRIRCARLRRG